MARSAIHHLATNTQNLEDAEDEVDITTQRIPLVAFEAATEAGPTTTRVASQEHFRMLQHPQLWALEERGGESDV
jgi:hypothetical protein